MVVGIKGADSPMVTIDEGRFESLGAARRVLAVRAEAGAPRAWACECLGDHEVHSDAIRAYPPARTFPGGEAPGGEEVADQRPLAELGWGHGQVGIRRVLGDRHVGVAGVEVDGLRADEDDRLAMLGERLGRVEQRGPSPNVERVRRARHPRFPASTSGAHLLRLVLARSR